MLSTRLRYNDLLVRTNGMAGTAAFDSAWARLLSRIETEPLYMQLDGSPANLEELATPAHRIWLYRTVASSLYGATGAPAYSAFHLGGDAPQPSATERREVSTAALYGAAAGAEAVRHVRVVARRAGRHSSPDEGAGPVSRV